MLTIKRMSLMVQTLKFMPTHQLFYLVYRRLPAGLRRFTARYAIDQEAIRNRPEFALTESAKNQQNKCENQSLVFLNQPPEKLLSKRFSWVKPRRSKLWRYNLHYFDWLKDPAVELGLQRKVIQHWIEHNPKGQEDAWEPYPLSIRIVNWVKYFQELDLQGNLIEKRWLISLYQQLIYLDAHIEFHIRANHLLKNLVALLYGCLYFQTSQTQRIFNKVVPLFHEELKEQFNADGGHYERSPMYHAICLEDLMDVYNLFKSNSQIKVGDALIDDLQERIQNGLIFLQGLHLTESSIALFADSAQGIALSLKDLMAYADHLGLSPNLAPNLTDRIESRYFSDTGYLCLTNDSLKCIASLGSPAPNYQPGHTHCDLFSFELALKGKAFIVDTGVYEYAEGKERFYSRSTQAHNTVQYGHLQQHEIWGAFRLAQRAKARVLEVETFEQGGSFLVQHDGFSRIKKGLTHTRLLTLENNRLLIEDELSVIGKKEKEVTLSRRDFLKARPLVSRLHFHPSVEVGPLDSTTGCLTLYVDQVAVARLAVSSVDTGDIQVDIHHCDYFPEFGKKYSGTCVEIARFGALPLNLVYRIDF